MPRRHRHDPTTHVVVPVEQLEDYRLVLAAATALAHSLAVNDSLDEQAVWLTRLKWAVEQMLPDDLDYYLTFAHAMEVEP